MSRDNDDHPTGWRSIYSDERSGDSDTGTNERGSEERDAPEPADAAPGRAASRAASGDADLDEADDVRVYEKPSRLNAEAQLRKRLERANEAAREPQPDLPPRSDRPDIGYPRAFLTPEEEEAAAAAKRRRQAAAEEEAESNGQPKAAPAPRRRKKGHPVLWSFCIALGLVIVAAASGLFYLWNGLRPASASEQPVRVTIDRGMRASRVAEELEKDGLIRNAFLFSAWLKLKGEGAGFQAGEYDFLPGMTREEIVAKLNAGDTVAAATIRFTIPEGFTVTQITDRLVKAGYVDKDKLSAAMAKPDQITGSVWTKTIPQDAKLRYPLEGYLFPETYEMKKGSTELDILNRMASELDRKLNMLPEDWQTTMQEKNLTVHQLLTIASLVEREVVVDDERPIVASVIENRLEKKMPLQIDATIQYLLDKQKEKLTTDDLKVDSPYNTYLHAGLPPGPIASPSLKSIEAVLYPADTDYLYYVTKKDGTNTHLFASTFKQHQKNIQASEKNEKAAKKQ